MVISTINHRIYVFLAAQQLVRDVQGVCDAVAHEDDETKDFQDTHGPAHQDLDKLSTFQ